MDSSLQKEVEKVQKESLDSIYEDTNLEQVIVPDLRRSVLSKIRDYDIEVAADALGLKLAHKVRDFANAIDLEHPSLVDLFEGELISGGFSEDCCGLLNIASFARKEEPTFRARIKKMIVKGKVYRSIEKLVDNPVDNQLHVRFVKDKSTRDSIRATKCMQTINLSIIDKKGNEIWDFYNGSFDRFVRNNNIWQQEIEEAKQELDRFKRLGCLDLAGGMQKDIEGFESQVRDIYYGFNRIPMTYAAIILAKVHSYSIKFVSAHSKHKILAPKSVFASLNNSFCLGSIEHDISWFNYLPRSYTIAELRENGAFSENMEKLIDRLENFPAVNGKPIFDHFRILVPGIEYPHGNGFNRKSAYINENGEKIVDSIQNVRIGVDMMFIRNKIYYPILLGEKDEHCYFISYWV